MGIRKVSGAKRKANTTAKQQTTAKNPALVVYHDGRAQINVRCKDLLSVTGLTAKTDIEKVLNACESLQNPEVWTKEDVVLLTNQLGRMPYPQMLEVEHLEGKKALLMRVAEMKGPGVVDLSYPEGSNRPWFPALQVLLDEGIRVPKGMCLEVPVALVEDDDQLLKVEAVLLRGVERAVKKDDEEEEEGEEE
ncbi:MAG: hypothetical protein K0R39_2724 [Symbiobacteriaceae bacterium]|jgi:hypothetical protein|nr:hypothetical protein [Symbiobacteriaceae bacterium]